MISAQDGPASDADFTPLADLVVVDLTQFLSGPYASQMLADLGARVIKVEPLLGDSSRAIRSHIVDGESAYFSSINRNKESIAVDLKDPRGQRLVLDLCREADLVLENFRPGRLDRLGLGFSALVAVNPAVVLTSISGFGQDGPYRDRPAYDIIVQALSGGMSITGATDGEPVRAGIPLGDLCAGMCGVIGSLAAVMAARATGVGTHVDVSMLDVQLSMLSYQAAYFLNGGDVPGPQGRAHASIPTYRSFRCRDGRDIVVAANTERMWKDLCRVLDLESLIEDPDFGTNECRLANRTRLDGLLEAAFVRRDAEEWDEALARAGVPAAPINDVAQALHGPQARHRRMVQEMEGWTGEPVVAVGNPIRRAGTGDGGHRRPPRLGEHTERILAGDLGLDDRQIDALVVAGVVQTAAGGDGAA